MNVPSVSKPAASKSAKVSEAKAPSAVKKVEATKKKAAKKVSSSPYDLNLDAEVKVAEKQAKETAKVAKVEQVKEVKADKAAEDAAAKASAAEEAESKAAAELKATTAAEKKAAEAEAKAEAAAMKANDADKAAAENKAKEAEAVEKSAADAKAKAAAAEKKTKETEVKAEQNADSAASKARAEEDKAAAAEKAADEAAAKAKKEEAAKKLAVAEEAKAAAEKKAKTEADALNKKQTEAITQPAQPAQPAALGKVGASASGGKVLPKEEVSAEVLNMLKVRSHSSRRFATYPISQLVFSRYRNTNKHFDGACNITTIREICEFIFIVGLELARNVLGDGNKFAPFVDKQSYRVRIFSCYYQANRMRLSFTTIAFGRRNSQDTFFITETNNMLPDLFCRFGGRYIQKSLTHHHLETAIFTVIRELFVCFAISLQLLSFLFLLRLCQVESLGSLPTKCNIKGCREARPRRKIQVGPRHLSRQFRASNHRLDIFPISFVQFRNMDGAISYGVNLVETMRALRSR
jgi:hypothetical protein